VNTVCRPEIILGGGQVATPSIPGFRELFNDISEYRRHTLFQDVLVPWIEKSQPAMVELSRFKSASPYDHGTDDAQLAMWDLYALSRVNDLLLFSFQHHQNSERTNSNVTEYEYAEFFTRIGFSVSEPNRFSPFHDEIVRVDQSEDEHEPTEILTVCWPALKFGDMLFSRAGVEVVSGQNHLVKGIADTSTLYFTFRRLHRRTNDLSMGWGSNSQWRTSFRRDYESDGKWIYNADGKNSLNSAASEEDRDGLTAEERIELCKHRCFVRSPKPDDDLWPFDDRFEETLALNLH
jgi:hypothetical protein